MRVRNARFPWCRTCGTVAATAALATR